MSIEAKPTGLAGSRQSLTINLQLDPREVASVSAASAAAYEKILDEQLPLEIELPAIDTLRKLNGQYASMRSDLRKIELQLQQADLDRETAKANLGGVELARAIAKADAAKVGLPERIDELKAAIASFRGDITKARGEAKSALEGIVSFYVVPAVATACEAQLAGAYEQLDAVVGPNAVAFAMADGLKSNLMARRGIAQRIARILSAV